MIVWTLFIAHKLLMIYIAISSVLIIIGNHKKHQVLLVSGFFITQALFGKCIVTYIENISRQRYGYELASNEFILHNLIGTHYLHEIRWVFLAIGTALLRTY